MSLLATLDEAPALPRPKNLFKEQTVEPLYSVQSRKILILGENGADHVVKQGTITADYQAIVSSDTEELITIASKQYKAVQDQYIDDAIMKLIEGTQQSENPLRLLKRVHPTRWSTEWGIVETVPSFNIPTKDSQGVYFTIQISNSYDKSGALKLGAGFTAIYCGNYFNYGYRKTNERDVSLKHTSGKDLENEVIAALLKGSEIRQTAIDIVSKNLDRDWLLARNATEDFLEVRKPLLEYGVE